MAQTTDSEKIEARANKQVQRARGRGRGKQRDIEDYEETTALAKEYPLNFIKQIDCPTLTPIQRAILNVYLLPIEGAANLPDVKVAEIVKARLGRCTRRTIAYFWTSPKCVEAINHFRQLPFKRRMTQIYGALTKSACAGDIRAITKVLEIHGDYTPAAAQQITFNQYNIGDDAAKAGFLQTVSNLKQISNTGKGEGKNTDQAVDAEFEVVKDDGSDVK